MKKIQSVFDYVFYRIYKFSQERGDRTPETNGTLILSLIQCLIILDLVVFIRIFYPFPLPNKIYIIPIVALPAVINWLRYERNFDFENLDIRWKHEEARNKIMNGWLIVLALIFSALVPVLHGYLEHNLRVI
jgi:hypothetical protein